MTDTRRPITAWRRPGNHVLRVAIGLTVLAGVGALLSPWGTTTVSVFTGCQALPCATASTWDSPWSAQTVSYTLVDPFLTIAMLAVASGLLSLLFTASRPTARPAAALMVALGVCMVVATTTIQGEVCTAQSCTSPVSLASGDALAAPNSAIWFTGWVVTAGSVLSLRMTRHRGGIARTLIATSGLGFAATVALVFGFHGGSGYTLGSPSWGMGWGVATAVLALATLVVSGMVPSTAGGESAGSSL